jgi:hypothetical protein
LAKGRRALSRLHNPENVPGIFRDLYVFCNGDKQMMMGGWTPNEKLQIIL